MTQSTTAKESSTARVVEDLLGGEAGASSNLQDQVERAASAIDARTAESKCRVLLAHLADNPQSVPELEALLILGLAHPDVFDSHRIPLAQEARRLAHLLELEGKIERAQTLLELVIARSPDDRQMDHELASMMRRTGNAGRLVERYMRNAEECVSGGRTNEAITWLQEVLLVDRSRRDVARMIRDLRWGDQEKRVKWRSRTRSAAIVLVLGLAITLVVQRELDITQRFAELPAAVPGNLTSLKARLGVLESFESDNPVSLTIYKASRERAQLMAEITQLEAQRAQIQLARHSEREAQLAIAESARKQGRILAQQNKFVEALEQFERALADGPAEWDQRTQIEADVAAIREWIALHGTTPVGEQR